MNDRPASFHDPTRVAGRRHVCLSGLLLLWVALCSVTQTRAQDDVGLFRARDDTGFFFRFSGNALLNVGVSVEAVRPVYGPGEYADGYVLPDISGSSLTWNWGYTSGDQVDVPNDQLMFDRYENLPALPTQDESLAAPGGELVAGLEIALIQLKGRTARVGLEVGFGFNHVSADTQASASGTATYTSGAYDLNGVVPPGAPYSGSFDGPGPLIGVTPTSLSSISAPTQVTSSGDFSADLYNFKLGVWLEYPLHRSLLTSISAGYSSIYADTQFSLYETVAASGQAFPTRVVDTTVGGRDNWKPGIYLQWRLDYELSPRVDLFLGLDYQWNGKMVYSGSERQVTLDYSAMFGVAAGVQLNF